MDAGHTRRPALVTGGTRGIGRAIACALAEAGHEVTVTWAHDAAAAAAFEAEAAEQGLAIRAARCDVTVPDEVAALLRGRDPGFHAVVHNAGCFRDRLLVMMPERDFDEVLAVSL